MLPLTVEFLAGNQLEQSVIHLIPSLEVSQKMVSGCAHSHPKILREACMILNIKLHILEATSYSMTLRVLNLVQLRNWRLSGSSLKGNL